MCVFTVMVPLTRSCLQPVDTIWKFYEKKKILFENPLRPEMHPKKREQNMIRKRSTLYLPTVRRPSSPLLHLHTDVQITAGGDGLTHTYSISQEPDELTQKQGCSVQWLGLSTVSVVRIQTQLNRRSLLIKLQFFVF